MTVGEAAAILANYERRMGDTLSPADLQDHHLTDKLKSEDYDLKGQVLPILYTFMTAMRLKSYLFRPEIGNNDLISWRENKLQVTMTKAVNEFSLSHPRGSFSVHYRLQRPLLL